MKLAVMAFALALTVAPLAGRVYRPPRGSPDEVLDRYFKMINDGALLTPEGWKRAATLFVHRSPAPRDETILVTTEYPLGNGPMSINGNRAEAWEKWVDDLGSIDSKLRYKPPARSDAEFVLRIYKLVLTDKHWETGEDGTSLKEVTGSQKWRIEGSLTVRSASKEAAIRYVTEMRDSALDPVVRTNADKTIGILKRLPAARTHI